MSGWEKWLESEPVRRAVQNDYLDALYEEDYTERITEACAWGVHGWRRKIRVVPLVVELALVLESAD